MMNTSKTKRWARMSNARANAIMFRYARMIQRRQEQQAVSDADVARQSLADTLRDIIKCDDWPAHVQLQDAAAVVVYDVITGHARMVRQ